MAFSMAGGAEAVDAMIGIFTKALSPPSSEDAVRNFFPLVNNTTVITNY